jgi:hypothetical protein
MRDSLSFCFVYAKAKNPQHRSKFIRGSAEMPHKPVQYGGAFLLQQQTNSYQHGHIAYGEI